MLDVFISYSRKDIEFGLKLHGALTASGIDTFIDTLDIPPAAPFRDELYRQIEDASSFVFIISPDSVISRNCLLEIEYAKKKGKRLIPIVRREVDSKPTHPVNAEEPSLSGSETLSNSPTDDRIEILVPTPLGEPNWIFFREEDDFATALNKLIRAIKTDLDWVRRHTEYEKRAIEWQNKKHDESLLLRGQQLREAEEWQAQAETAKEPEPTALQKEFIAKSRQSETKSRKSEMRRVRIVRGTVAVAVVIAIILIPAAIIQSNVAYVAQETAISSQRDKETQQKLAFSRQLASDALKQVNNDPQLSILLAIQAAQTAYTTEAEDALRQTLQLSTVFILHGHVETVDRAIFSPDGKRVATTSSRRAIVWDMSTGSQLFVLNGNPWIDDIAFSPDSKFLLVADNIGTARMWDGLGSVVEFGEHEEYKLNSVAFSPDGKFIVVASDDGIARIWDSHTKQTIFQLRGHAGGVTSAVFSPDGKLVVTGGRDNVARIWTAATGRMVAELRGHTQELETVAFSPDGKTVLTVSLDNTARLWEARTGQAVAAFVGHTNTISSAAFSPDSKYIVTASLDGTVRVWESSSGKNVYTLQGNPKASAAFSPDGKYLVIAGGGNAAGIYDFAAKKLVAVLNGHTGATTDAVFSPDGKYVVTSSYDQTARVWDVSLASSQLVGSITLGDPYNPIRSTAFSSDGSLVATMSTKATEIWQVDSGQMVVKLEDNKGENREYLDFSPDGSLFATSGKDDKVRIWETKTWQEIAELGNQLDKTARFSSDGRHLIISTSLSQDHTVDVWDTKTWDEIIKREWTGGSPEIILSADGSLAAIVSLDESRVQVYDVNSGQAVSTVPRSEYVPIRVVSFSSDGKLLATASYDNVVRLWDVKSGEKVAEMRGHENVINTISFSQDSTMIVTSSDDFTARVWDVRTGRSIVVLRGHFDKVKLAVFSSNARYIATGSDDTTARIWEMSSGKSIATIDHDFGVEDVSFNPNSKVLMTLSYGRAHIYECDQCISFEDLLSGARARAMRDFTCEERQIYLHETLPCPTPTPPVTPGR